MTLIQFLALVWGISAAVCLEAYMETKPHEKWKWSAIAIGSLAPVFNTLIATHFAMDKIKKGT